MESDPIDILVVEDDPAHVELITRSLSAIEVPAELIHVLNDGLEALAYLRRQGDYRQAPRPDLILLDLNLPRMSGRDVLAEIKGDPVLRQIPVVVLTTSRSNDDIVTSYNLRANSYVTKPIGFDEFLAVMKAIRTFWLETAILPRA